jgi:hypothetical protein
MLTPCGEGGACLEAGSMIRGVARTHVIEAAFRKCAREASLRAAEAFRATHACVVLVAGATSRRGDR